MELLDALAAINQPSSIFKTLRCDARPDSIKRKSYAQTLSSYVTVTFELLNCNVEENYRRLYREFGQTPLSPQPGDATVMNFIPVPVDFVEHDCAGTALDIYMIGAGQSEAEAGDAWRTGVTALTYFLLGISAKYTEQIEDGGPRIS